MIRSLLMRYRRQLLACFLSLIACICSLLIALSGPDLRRSEFTWSTSEGDRPGVFQLSRGWPEVLDFEISCRSIELASEGLVISTGGLVLERSDGFLRLRDNLADTRDLNARIPNQECGAGFHFDSKLEELSVFAGANRDTIQLRKEAFPEVSSIFVPPSLSSENLQVRIITQPWGQEGSWSRFILAISVALAGVTSTFLVSRRQYWKRVRSIEQRSRSGSTTPIVALLLMISAFLVPPLLDDGWVLHRLRHLLNSGANSALYDAKDAWLPQGNFHELFLAFLVDRGFSFIAIRLVVVLSLVVTWELIRRFVLDSLLGVGKVAIWFAASVFTLFSIGWLITLRAEPWVVLFAAVSWAGFSRLYRDTSLLGFFFALTGAGLAVTAHQAGWTAIAPGAFAIAIAVRRSEQGIVRRIVISLVALNSLVISLMSLCIRSSLRIIISSAQDFASNTTTHSYSIFSEIVRYRDLLTLASSVRLASILLLLLMLIYSAIRLSPSRKVDVTIWLLASTSLLGLLLTSSKWLWHFGAYTVPATIFTGLAFSKISTKVDQKRPIFSILLPLIVLIAATTTSVTSEWGQADLASRSWAEFADRFSASSNERTWLICILLSVIVGVLADRHERPIFRVIALTSTPMAVLCVPVLSLGWIANDALLTEGWSFPKQNVQTFFGKNKCDDERFFAGLQPLPFSSLLYPRTVPLIRGAVPEIPSLVNNNPPEQFPIWGSWSISLTQPSTSQPIITADSAKGEFTTPIFPVSGLEELSLWFASGGADTVEFSVVLMNDARYVDEVTIEPQSEATWEFSTFTVKPGTTEAFVRISDQSADVGGWGAVSALAEPRYMSALEINAVGKVYVGPFEAIKYPCLDAASPEGGVWPHLSFVTEEASYFSFLFGSRIPVIDLGCSVSATTCIRRTDYQMATVQRRDL